MVIMQSQTSHAWPNPNAFGLHMLCYILTSITCSLTFPKHFIKNTHTQTMMIIIMNHQMMHNNERICCKRNDLLTQGEGGGGEGEGEGGGKGRGGGREFRITHKSTWWSLVVMVMTNKGLFQIEWLALNVAHSQFSSDEFYTRR